jgi:hypothetical protein
MTQPFALFNNFNLLKTISPKAYASFTDGGFNAMGMASPDQMSAFMKAQGGQLKSYNDLLMANQTIMRRQDLLNSAPEDIRAKLGNNPSTHMVGNAMVLMGQDGKGLAVHGANMNENLGALAVLRTKYADGTEHAATIDRSMENMRNEILRRQGLQSAPAPTPAPPPPGTQVA